MFTCEFRAILDGNVDWTWDLPLQNLSRNTALVNGILRNQLLNNFMSLSSKDAEKSG